MSLLSNYVEQKDASFSSHVKSITINERILVVSVVHFLGVVAEAITRYLRTEVKIPSRIIGEVRPGKRNVIWSSTLIGLFKSQPASLIPIIIPFLKNYV